MDRLAAVEALAADAVEVTPPAADATTDAVDAVDAVEAAAALMTNALPRSHTALPAPSATTIPSLFCNTRTSAIARVITPEATKVVRVLHKKIPCLQSTRSTLQFAHPQSPLFLTER